MKVVIIVLLTLAWGIARGSGLDELHNLAEEFYSEWARFDPVWGTEVGIHCCDSLMPNVSTETGEAFGHFIVRETQRLDAIDTAGWAADDKIDYSLLSADVKYNAPNAFKAFFDSTASFTCAIKCRDAFRLLMGRGNYPFGEKSAAAFARLTKIPDFLSRCERTFGQSSHDASYFGQGTAFVTAGFIKGFAELLIDGFPENNAEIATSRDKAVLALAVYSDSCPRLYANKNRKFKVGKEAFNRLLAERYFLNFDADSLLQIALWVCKRADSLKEEYYIEPPETHKTGRSGSDVFTGPPVDSVIRYCEAEVDRIREFMEESDILTIPPGLSECLFKSAGTLGFPYSNDDFYIAPGQLDENQTGLYLGNLEILIHPIDRPTPQGFIIYPFRARLVRDVIPGQHMLYFAAHGHPSLIRRIQRNDMLANGWGLYFRELLATEGLLGQDGPVMRDFYRELKLYALGAINNIQSHCGGFENDSASILTRELIGEDSAAFYHFSHKFSYPAGNLSYAVGYYLIIDMMAKAKEKEADRFNLKDFHDRILSEGCIPPALIARKYGWQ